MTSIEFPLWPRQYRAYTSEAREVLYGGSAGGGKSHLARVALITWCLQIPGLQTYLFRREYADVIRNHMLGPTGLASLLQPFVSAGLCEVTAREVKFLNGSAIHLCHCQHDKDVFGYQGAEIHVLLIEEATQFTEFQMRYLRTRVRLPSQMRESIPAHLRQAFPRIVYTTNPGGVGHLYLKQAFVDAAPPDTLFIAPEGDGGLTREFIVARLADNPSLDPVEYAKQLGSVSPVYAKALLDGDWSAVVGAFFPEFSRERHVVPRLNIPSYWARFRTYDWGSTSPFAVYWWATADGNPIFSSKGEVTFPRGSIIAYREWYGSLSHDPTKGIGLSNEEQADGILARSSEVDRNVVTLTDSLPFQDRGGATIAQVFAGRGLVLTRGDTSRVPGWSQFRSRLIGSDRGPMIYFTEDCPRAIELIPQAMHDPRDPEELICVADHAHDAIRLACMARAFIKDERPPLPTDNRTTPKGILSKLTQQGPAYVSRL